MYSIQRRWQNVVQEVLHLLLVIAAPTACSPRTSHEPVLAVRAVDDVDAGRQQRDRESLDGRSTKKSKDVFITQRRRNQLRLILFIRSSVKISGKMYRTCERAVLFIRCSVKISGKMSRTCPLKCCRSSAISDA